MDSSLRREHEAFKKRAMAMPSVEVKPKKSSTSSGQDSQHSKPKSHKRAKVDQPKVKTKEFDYKAVSGSSDFNFAILAKIVQHLRKRHQEGETDALSLDEILEETGQILTNKQRHWLSTEALMNNPKIEVIDMTLFKFKPIYNIRDRKGLLRLLDSHDQKGLGGILADDVEESLPNFAKAIKALGDQIMIVTRPIDKRQVLYYNDKSIAFTVDDEMQKLWRSVTVEGTDERKIEDYLQKHNIVAMQDLGIKKVAVQRRKTTKKRALPFKTHNEHLGDLLQDYSEMKKT